MNMERERGRPFFACIFTRRKQREIISILPAGDFEKWCSSLSLSLEGRLLPSNEILLSFASFCRLSIHPSTHPSLPSLSPHSTPFTARQGYPIPHSSHPLYPLACQISPSKANPFLPSSSPFKRRPSVRSCVDPVSELSTFPRLFSPPRTENWRSFESRLDSRETLEAEDAPFEFENLEIRKFRESFSIRRYI